MIGRNPLVDNGAGAGSVMHFATESFTLMAGIQVTHVPYKGLAQAIADLLPRNEDA